MEDLRYSLELATLGSDEVSSTKTPSTAEQSPRQRHRVPTNDASQKGAKSEAARKTANRSDIGSFEPKEKDLEGKDNPKDDHGNEKRRSSEEQFDHDHNENGQEVDEKSSTAAVALDLKTRATMDLQADIRCQPPPPVDLQAGMR